MIALTCYFCEASVTKMISKRYTKHYKCPNCGVIECSVVEEVLSDDPLQAIRDKNCEGA